MTRFTLEIGPEFTKCWQHSVSCHRSYPVISSILKNVAEQSPNSFDITTSSLALTPQTYYRNISSSSQCFELFKNLKGNKLTAHTLPVLFDVSPWLTSTSKTENFFSLISDISNSSLSDTPYPIAVRYVDDNGTMFIERPPTQIQTDFRIGRKTVTNCSIWIPWTICALHPNDPTNFYIYFGSKPLSSMEDTYVVCILPNTYENGHICFSNSLASYDRTSFDFRQLFSTFYSEYMSGGWNDDLSSNFYQYYLAFDRMTEKQRDQFPMVRRFFEAKIDDLKSIIPSSFDPGLFSNGLVWSNRNNAHRLCLYILSSFSLEETLQFYAELSSILPYNDKTRTLYTFANIVKYQQHEHGNGSIGYSALFKNIQNQVIAHQYEEYASPHYNSFSVLFDHPEPNHHTLQVMNENALNYLYEVRGIVSNSLITQFSEYMHQQDKLGYNQRFIFVVNSETFEWKATVINPVHIYLWYAEYIKQNYTIPMSAQTSSSQEV